MAKDANCFEDTKSILSEKKTEFQGQETNVSPTTFIFLFHKMFQLF